jgi:hypothetical protein
MSVRHVALFGPIILDLEPDDIVEFGWDPEERVVRLVTRSRDHVRRRVGSYFNVHMSPEQLEEMLTAGGALLRMIKAGRVPGDRPLPADSPVVEEIGSSDPLLGRGPATVKES